MEIGGEKSAQARSEAAAVLAAAATAGESAEGHRAGETGFRAASVAMFAAGLGTFALLYLPQPLLPLLSRSFHVSPAASALSLSVTTAAVGLGLFPAGMLSERIGRVAVMRWSVLLSALLGIACALAPSFGALLAIRGLQGVALAGLPGVAMTYLAEEIHPGSLGRSIGLYIGGNAIGGMLGRLLAGWLSDLGGWRPAMAGVGLLSLACALAFARLVPQSRFFNRRQAGLRGTLADLRAQLTERGLLRLYVEGGLLMGVFVAVYNALGFRLQDAPYGLGQTAIAAVFLVYPIGSLASSMAGRLSDTVGRRRVLPAAIVLAAGGLAVTAAGPLPLVILGIALLTAGFFAAHSVASSWIPRRAGNRGEHASPSQASALYLLCYYLGSSLSGPLAGAAWSSGGWREVMVFTGALLAVAFITALRLARTPPLVTSPAH